MIVNKHHFFSSTMRSSAYLSWRVLRHIFALLALAIIPAPLAADSHTDLGAFKKGQAVSDFRVTNLYSDRDQKIIGAKFFHQPSGAPVYLLQIETVPQAYMWVDTPVTSDRGLPHALEHLLAQKGIKGRYASLLAEMRLSLSVAATWRDFNFYSLASGSGMEGFFELFRARFDALFHPDFTDAEAEREFYHFGVATAPSTKERMLIEGGSVYNEELADQGEENCFRDLKVRTLGRNNPLASRISGDPDQMRTVTPDEIREFHRANYRLGPTTGFIFVIDPKENTQAFLEKVASVLTLFVKDGTGSAVPQLVPGKPRYPMAPAERNVPEICPVPAANESAPSTQWFLWKPQAIRSMTDLRLLNLFFQGLADGPRSLLYRSIVDGKTRETDTGATNVALDPALTDSPASLLWSVAVSGIPGNTISIEKITQIRNVILTKIRQVASFPDGSAELVAFQNLIASYAEAQRRSKHVWMRNSPLFGGRLDADWKDFLEFLEMDPSFIRSLSEDSTWTGIEAELTSGRNIWRDLIQKYQLQDPPYALATQPSPHLLQRMEADKRERISAKTKSLREQYHVSTDQEALAQFEQHELMKTREIDQIESRVIRPHFTEHPPLTLDDGVRYSQVQIQGVPGIAVLFDRPPTLELGLSFDLRQIPRKYYKYLPVLARTFDSLGFKQGDEVISYSELLTETSRRFVAFESGTADSPLTHRADLTFKVSVTSIPEFREALDWVKRALLSSNLDPGNIQRLRDIIAERIATDDSYIKQPEHTWVFTPALAFRYQSDALYLALESQFTKAHWDGRLRWLLHEQVSVSAIDALGAFADRILAESKGASRKELTQRLTSMKATGLEAELIDHWKRNLNAFPENKLLAGLATLAREAQEDLRSGPAQAVHDLKELQHLVVNRRLLRLDLLVSSPALHALQPDLAKFIGSLPDRTVSADDGNSREGTAKHPVVDNLVQQSDITAQQAPWYLGLVIPDEVPGNITFYSDFFTYSQTGRGSLVGVLSSGILSGLGPNSVFMKSREAGLAYGLFMRPDPGRGLLLYYADRSLDVPSLISSMNSAVDAIPAIRDSHMVDYALRQAFPVFPRSSLPFSMREQMLVQDMRDDNTPEKVRQFYAALMKIRHAPNLLSEITRSGKDSLCGVLLEEACKHQQKTDHSIFFFVSSEKSLSEIEQRLPIKLVRIWPSDYWLN